MKGNKQGDGERTSKRGRVDGNREKSGNSVRFSQSHMLKRLHGFNTHQLCNKPSKM